MEYSTIANAIAAIVLAGLTCAILRVYRAQARYMREQADTMRNALVISDTNAKAAIDAARAAQGNTDALVAIERPWVIAQIHRPPPGPPGGYDPYAGEAPGTPTSSFTVQVLNYGRSPAWIVSHGVRCECISNLVPDDLPLPPEEPYGYLQPAGPLGPRGEGDGKVIHRTLSLTAQERDRLLRSDALVIFLGWIRYRDPLRRIHRASFCFVFLRRRRLGLLEETQVPSWEESQWLPRDGPSSYFADVTEEEDEATQKGDRP